MGSATTSKCVTDSKLCVWLTSKLQLDKVKLLCRPVGSMTINSVLCVWLMPNLQLECFVAFWKQGSRPSFLHVKELCAPINNANIRGRRETWDALGILSWRAHALQLTSSPPIGSSFEAPPRSCTVQGPPNRNNSYMNMSEP